MAEGNPGVTLDTLHDDLTAGFADLKAEVRTGFGDLKATLIAGFRSLPGREASEEMIRLLREANRIQEERSTQLDLRIREQHLETQQVLHATVEGQRLLVEGQRLLVEAQRSLSTEVKALSTEIKALVARLDALIKGRGNGEPIT